MFFSFPYKAYIAIIGDMKQSKMIIDRNTVQVRLKEVLRDMNENYANDIASKFTITLGDEFQGLLNCGANVMQIISTIERKMYPIRIRFGIGIGEITTEIDHEIAIGADGPAYYKARAAIAYLKEIEKRKQTGTPNIRLEVDREVEATSAMINTILTLMTVIKESWSDRQREIIADILEYQDGQMNVAKRLHISQPAVQKSLANGNFYAYKDAMETIEKAMKEIRREDVS
jgi:hypothetical protein